MISIVIPSWMTAVPDTQEHRLKKSIKSGVPRQGTLFLHQFVCQTLRPKEMGVLFQTYNTSMSIDVIIILSEVNYVERTRFS